MADGYAVLGIHGEDVASVPQNVVRVRMEVGEQIIDEDFVLPRIITIEEQVHDAVSRRINELRAGNLEQSDVVDVQLDRVVSSKTEADFDGIAVGPAEGVENV